MSISTLESTPLTVKTVFDDDTRRVQLRPSSEVDFYTQLLSHLRLHYPEVENGVTRFRLTYTDPDGDVCVVGSQQELLEAARCAAPATVVKLKVTLAVARPPSSASAIASRPSSSASAAVGSPLPANTSSISSSRVPEEVADALDSDSDDEYVNVSESSPKLQGHRSINELATTSSSPLPTVSAAATVPAPPAKGASEQSSSPVAEEKPLVAATVAYPSSSSLSTHAQHQQEVTVEDVTESERAEDELVQAIIHSSLHSTPAATTNKSSSVVADFKAAAVTQGSVSAAELPLSALPVPAREFPLIRPTSQASSSASSFTTASSSSSAIPSQPAASAASSSFNGSGVHSSHICDGCGASPIVGVRHRCTVCPDFDLCYRCHGERKEVGAHRANHVSSPVSAPATSLPLSGDLEADPVSVANARAQGVAVHEGVRCDQCRVSPILGTRYKCTVCHNFDLCSSCESRALPCAAHQPQHSLIKIKEPASRFSYGGHHHRGGHGWRHRLASSLQQATAAGAAAGAESEDRCGGHRWRRWAHRYGSPAASSVGDHDETGRAQASFVADVTLPDGQVVAPGARLLKTWSIQNAGAQAFPEGTRLQFTGGDLIAASSSSSASPVDYDASSVLVRAAAGEVVHVSITLEAPQEEGRIRAKFRLVAPDAQGQMYKFGPRMWIELLVKKPLAASSEAATAAPASSPSSVDPAAAAARPVDVVRGAVQQIVAALTQAGSAQQQQGGAAGIHTLLDLIQSVSQRGASDAVPAASAPSTAAAPASAPFAYAAQLEVVRGMGIVDDDALAMRLLQRYNGDVTRTINQLLTL